VLYPAVTVFVIVLTANHYFADAIAGLVVLAVSYILARVATPHFDRWLLSRQGRRAANSAQPEVPASATPR
jgi:hypothetical protein